MPAQAMQGRGGGRPASARPPAAAAGAPPAVLRWYTHPYNRARLYRLAGVFGAVPRPARLALARRIGPLVARWLPAERAAIRKALVRVTGAEGAALDGLVRGVFRDFAMCFSDLVSTNRRPADWLAARVVGERQGGEWLEVLAGGAISLSAHVGSWELAGRLLAQRGRRPTHVVVAEGEAPELLRWVRRDGEGVRFVPRARPTVSVELVAALRRGELVALQGDRALGNAGDVPVPFFGEPASFPVGPFRLARATGVPIFAAFCLLGLDGRYRVIVREPLRVAAGGEDAALHAWVAGLEEIVRRHPTQWFNFFDVWSPFGA